MGVGPSSVLRVDEDRQGLGDLPESCVASLIVHLDATEICGLARLNRAFRGAAAADVVWESKLPKNYAWLLEKAGEEMVVEGKKVSKKEIYARLCRPNPLDGGKKVFWLEKYTGGVCMAISAKALHITGIDDRRYWNYIPTRESRFHTVAYLHQIWWFEVVGEIDFCFPAGTYSIFFRLQLGRSSKRLGRWICNTEHVHGWDVKPARFQLSTSCGQKVTTKCFLDDEPGKWVHYHVGDFSVETTSTMSTRVKFSVVQIDCTHTKGGLCVDSVLICPLGLRPEKFFTGSIR